MATAKIFEINGLMEIPKAIKLTEISPLMWLHDFDIFDGFVPDEMRDEITAGFQNQELEEIELHFSEEDATALYYDITRLQEDGVIEESRGQAYLDELFEQGIYIA